MSILGEKPASQKLCGVRGLGQSGKKFLTTHKTMVWTSRGSTVGLRTPPAKHVAVFALKAAQIRVVKKTEEYQRKVRTARGERHEKRYNEKNK